MFGVLLLVATVGRKKRFSVALDTQVATTDSQQCKRKWILAKWRRSLNDGLARRFCFCVMKTFSFSSRELLAAVSFLLLARSSVASHLGWPFSSIGSCWPLLASYTFLRRVYESLSTLRWSLLRSLRAVIGKSTSLTAILVPEFIPELVERVIQSASPQSDTWKLAVVEARGRNRSTHSDVHTKNHILTSLRP